MPENNDQWFCVKLKPGGTKIAEYDMKRLGFSVFNPLFTTRRVNQRTRLVTEVIRPLFPNYFFTPLDLDEDCWERVRYSVRGVKELLGGFGVERPTPVPQRVMNELLIKCGHGPLRELAELTLFKKNEQVRIIEGPFTGEWGRVEWSDEARVSVLLTFFGRDTPVTLSVAAVEKVVRV